MMWSPATGGPISLFTLHSLVLTLCLSTYTPISQYRGRKAGRKQSKEGRQEGSKASREGGKEGRREGGRKNLKVFITLQISSTAGKFPLTLFLSFA